MNKNWKLYVLKLEDEKWYVGITTQPVEKRFLQHKRGFAAARWTKMHPPLSIYDTEDLGVCDIERAQKYEGRVTRKYMEEYGDDNVRGGDLTDVDKYVRRFGYFWPKESWKGIVMVAILTLSFCLLYIDKFVFSFIPGGVR